uniref:Uncharacterized protein n=1 Tax=Anguilla anguilla TaxID=7936 RepID=A0A0E9TAE8_ANGAN
MGRCVSLLCSASI